MPLQGATSSSSATVAGEASTSVNTSSNNYGFDSLTPTTAPVATVAASSDSSTIGAEDLGECTVRGKKRN